MNNQVTQKKVLVLLDEPPPYGGVRVSALQTFESLSYYKDIGYIKFAYETGNSNSFILLSSYIRSLFKVDAVLFLVGDILQLRTKRGKFFYLIASLLSKPIIFKGFAGGLKQSILSLNATESKSLKKKLLSCSLLTVQTKVDFEFLKQWLIGGKVKVEWYPNVRESNDKQVQKIRSNRFCFVGKISKEKGVDLIIDVINKLPTHISIDLYGPISENDTLELNIKAINNPRINFKGTIDSKEVSRVIAQYDALLLPTVWKTEGHPGVVLEAFSTGTPVIATNWNGIPELIKDDAGVLIDTKSVESLKEAILLLSSNDEIWQQMCNNAFRRIKEFNPFSWSAKFHSWINDIIK
jgi:glycosyltransferase involved in cell wall biosynthesis